MWNKRPGTDLEVELLSFADLECERRQVDSAVALAGDEELVAAELREFLHKAQQGRVVLFGDLRKRESIFSGRTQTHEQRQTVKTSSACLASVNFCNRSILLVWFT